MVVSNTKNDSYLNMKYLNQYISVVAAAFTFFVTGIQLGGVSPYLEKLDSDGYNGIPPIDSLTKSLLTSTLTLGILPGAFMSSYASDLLGRKYSLILLTVPAFLSQIFQYFATHISMVYLTIVFRGIICAWSFAVVPTYVSEIASPHLRGPFTVFCVMFVSLGIFVGSLIQATVSIELTPIIGGITVLVILAILCFISESPYMFMVKNQQEKCIQALRKFRGEQNVDKEYEEIKAAWNDSLKAKQVGWLTIFTVPLNLKVFLICAGVQTVQQFTGHIVMSTNIHSIVKNSGLNLTLTQISIIVNSASTCATILSIFVVDSWGRKPLFIFVSSGACLGHLITGLGFFIENLKGDTSLALGVTELIGNLIYLMMVGMGLLHLPNILGAELFPTDIKTKGCSLLMVVSSLEGVIVSLSFDFLSKIAYYVPFLSMAGCAFLGLIFGIFCVPETKNKSLTEIQKQLKV